MSFAQKLCQSFVTDKMANLIEHLPAYELPHYGSMRDCLYLVRSQSLEDGKEIQQRAGFFLCWRLRSYFPQQRLCVVFQQRIVIESGRIEHHLSILLVREDVQSLSPSD